MVFWVLVIFLDYWQKHPGHYYAFDRFSYTDLTIGLGILCAGVTGLVLVAKKKSLSILRYFNGLSVWALSLAIISLCLWSYLLKTANPPIDNISEFLTVLGRVSITALFTYSIVVVCYSLGQLLDVLLEVNLRNSGQTVTNIAAGMMVLVLFLFVCGIFGFLKFYILFMLLLFLLALNWRGAWQFIKASLFQPIELPKDLNVLGVASFFFLLFLICLNFLNIITPLPKGFDSLTLYINLPGLIRDYSGLVEGFQPYNWSLLMSIGYIIFDKTEVVMALSALGGLLSLFAMYELGKNWLRINANYLLFALLVFYSTPSIFHQSSDELKIDLGLLFICLCIILLFVEWLHRLQNEEDHNQTISIFYYTGEQIQNGSLLVLAALLMGFALGIKLTAFFIFFGLIAALWYALNGKLAFLGVCSIVLSAMFIVKLDDVSGLRQYHYTVEIWQWLLLAIGVGLLIWNFTTNKGQFKRSIYLSILITVITMIPFLPWVAKNYIETQSFSPKTLLNGKNVGPEMDMKIINTNWIELKRAQKEQNNETGNVNEGKKKNEAKNKNIDKK